MGAMTDMTRGHDWGNTAAYEAYIGRWSRLVAEAFLLWLALPSGRRWLDVGCGTGALTQTILALQAQSEPGVVAHALGAVAHHGAEVHQAAGMLAVRLGTTVGEALVRLRAHAFGEDRPLAEIARDVVAGRLSID